MTDFTLGWQIAYLGLLALAVFLSYKRGFADGTQNGILGTFWTLQNEGILNIHQLTLEMKKKALDKSRE